MIDKTNGITRYINVHRAHGPSWFYDGTQLAYVADTDGLDQAWLLIPGQKEPRQLTHFPNRVGLVACSPVDERLIVTADAEGNEHDQLYLIQKVGDEPEPLTHVSDVIHYFGAWSPDGRFICYSSNERHPAFFDVWIMDVLTRETHCVMQQDASLMASCWSSDGTKLIASRINTLVDSDLFLVPLDGSEPRLLTSHNNEAVYENPCFAPDGSTVYTLTNCSREFIAPAALDIAEASASGHVPLQFLAETIWDAEALALSHDGTSLSWALNEDGRSRLVFYDVRASKELPAPHLPLGVVEGLTWNPSSSRVAFSFNGPLNAGNIWTASPDREDTQQETRIDGLDTASLVQPELIRYLSFDGLEIPAYYYRPRTTSLATSNGLLPTLIFIHGGPEGQFRPICADVWLPPIQYYLHQGFAVLAPNIRGSTGYGKSYVHLDDVRLRPNSIADIKSAVEWLITHGQTDPKRIGIIGRSYGGYAVLAAITEYPDLWAAAVDIVGIANFATFLENTGPWRRKLRESEYGSLEHDREFLEQISPIHHVDRITASLFVVHGANDPRVPVGEAEQIMSALRSRDVPVEYMRFEDEGHGLVKRANRLIAYPAIARFLDKYMGQA